MIGAKTTKVNIDISETLSRELNYLIKRAEALNNEFNSIEDREMQIDLHLSYILCHALCHYWWPPTDYEFQRYVQIIKTQALEMGLVELANRLASLDTPVPESKRWKEFASDFQAIILEERMIGRIWTPSIEQCRLLNAYLGGSLLLLEALEVAAVSNRLSVKNNLLVNPKHRDSDQHS